MPKKCVQKNIDRRKNFYYYIDNRYIDNRYIALEMAILLTLTEQQHGYGIMQEVERRTEGRVRIGAGTLYSLLSRFEEEDIIVQVSEENRRKTYVITDKGLSILRDEYQRLKQLVSDGRHILEEGVKSDEEKN